MSAARSKARYIVVLALGVVLGSILVPPVAAHVTERFGHLWGDHIKPRLSADGTVNDPANPVSWGQLKDVPAGFADGEDASQDGDDTGKRTILAPHVFETKGSAKTEANATDFEIKALYRRGVVAGCGGGNFCPGATVSLYLFDDSGTPMQGGDASTGTARTAVCNPCTRDLGTNARTVTFSLQDLITNAGGFEREVKLGYGVIVVGGQDPEGVSIQGFVVNSHTGPFDLTTSYPTFQEVPSDEATGAAP
ncbi:MAG TPA: hypothetical protein VG318_14240 [Actinomycetota bacterium]|nr:hypothetical protein [Actinomycetota bacterium]